MNKAQSGFTPRLLLFTVKETLNEDDGFYAFEQDVCILAAFDGCGGMGGRKYQLLDDMTSAYLGSHLYADTVKAYFEDTKALLIRDGIYTGWAQGLECTLRLRAEEYKRDYLDREPSLIVGSMARALPSTAAIALIDAGRGICHFYWAGDSRGYVLCADGLRQYTQDDLVGMPDAFDNIRADAALSNYLCADRPFTLHDIRAVLPKKCIVMTATDGMFGYLPTPIHTEALLLETMQGAKNMREWMDALQSRLKETTADDVTLALWIIGFRSFTAIKKALAPRYRELKQRYLEPFEALSEEDTAALQALWRQYKAEMLQ